MQAVTEDEHGRHHASYLLSCLRSCCSLLFLSPPALLLGLLISATPVRTPVPVCWLRSPGIICQCFAALCQFPDLRRAKFGKTPHVPILESQPPSSSQTYSFMSPYPYCNRIRNI